MSNLAAALKDPVLLRQLDELCKRLRLPQADVIKLAIEQLWLKRNR